MEISGCVCESGIRGYLIWKRCLVFFCWQITIRDRGDQVHEKLCNLRSALPSPISLWLSSQWHSRYHLICFVFGPFYHQSDKQIIFKATVEITGKWNFSFTMWVEMKHLDDLVPCRSILKGHSLWLLEYIQFQMFRKRPMFYFSFFDSIQISDKSLFIRPKI